MAIATLDFQLRPEDGWVKVATNPSRLKIKPGVFHPWWVAITVSGAPAAGLIGMPMGKDDSHRREPFETDGALTGEVYVRIETPPASTPSSKMHLSVIRDQT